MPWTVADVEKHNSGLSDQQKKRWVEVANSARTGCLARGGNPSDCDTQAVIAANKAVARMAMFAGTVSIRAMEIFKTGTWNGQSFDQRDLQEMVDNFNALKGQVNPILKITHRKDQESLAGLASYGDVVNMYTGDGGNRLFADVDNVPEEVAGWIRDRRFPQRSIELSYRFTVNTKVYRNVITAVALLGSELPAVAGLEPVSLSKEDNELEGALCFEVDEKSASIEIVKNVNNNTKTEGGGDNMDLQAIMEKIASLEAMATNFLKKQDEAKAELAKKQSDEERTALQNKVAEYTVKIQELDSMKEEYQRIKASFEKVEKENLELKKKAKEAEVDGLLASLKAEGKLLPAFESEAKSILMAADVEGKKIGTFATIDAKGATVSSDLSMFEAFKNLLKKLPKLVEFKEQTSSGVTKGAENMSGEQKTMHVGTQEFAVSNADLNTEAEKYAKEHKCSLTDAMIAVSKQFKAEGKSQGCPAEE